MPKIITGAAPPAIPSHRLADELARIGNLLIAENERLTNELRRRNLDVTRLREVLEAMPVPDKEGDAQLSRRHALATTGERPFRGSESYEVGRTAKTTEL